MPYVMHSINNHLILEGTTMNYPADQNPAEIAATIKELLDLRHTVEDTKYMEVWAALMAQAVLLKHVNWR